MRARRSRSLERFELVDGQRVLFRLPKPQHNDTTALSLRPLALIDQLGALIAPPRLHRHRYDGILAPNSCLLSAATAYDATGVAIP
ncbi:MAG: transposase [Thiohalocapsa sp.]